MKYLKTGIVVSLLCIGFFSYQTLLSSYYSEKCGCSEKSISPVTTEDETLTDYGELNRNNFVRGSNVKAVKMLTGKVINDEDVNAFREVMSKGGYVDEIVANLNQLINDGYNVCSCDYEYHWTPLHYAIAGNAPLEIIQCFVNAGADPLAEDWENCGHGRPLDLVRQYKDLPDGVKRYVENVSRRKAVKPGDSKVSRLINSFNEFWE